jgi:cytochrome c-type biogenesis protein CcmH/NrfF
MTRLLLILLLLLPAGLAAQTAERSNQRTPEEAHMLYTQVGSQLFCICGCRENLLTCSMNVCNSKVQQRRWLRELSRNAALDAAEIKEAMAEQFGPNVLQVPPRSSLYPILAIGLLLIVTAFAFGFWALTRGRDPMGDPTGGTDPAIDARIERELKELE